MYPKNAASPERIAVGAVVLIADGTVQTSGVSITVVPQGGTTAAGGGTTSYEQGVVFYLPIQAETNYSSFIVTAYKASCIPVSVTVVTTASATAGKVVLSGETHTSAVIPTVTTLTGHTAQTGDSYARLGAPAGASVSADVAAVKVDTAATLVDTAEIGAAGAGLTALATAANLATVAGYVDTEVAAILAAVDTEVAAIKAKTDNLPAAFPTNFGAMVITAGGIVDADVEAVTGDTGAAAKLKRVLLGNVTGTVGAASTTTSVVTSSLNPAASVTDQYKGKVLNFSDATTTAALRGQSTDITGSTAGGVLACTALTTAPVSGDEFTIS